MEIRRGAKTDSATPDGHSAKMFRCDERVTALPASGNGPTRIPASASSRRGTAAAFLLALGSAVSTATASDPTERTASAEADRIPSVASILRRPAIPDLRPIRIIDRSEIELSGIRNLWDFLAGRLDHNYFGLAAPFDLGPFRIAILINGRRISDSAFDLDSLPVFAIERIEVLAGGAPVQHGPHALSGAINVVLRDRVEGIETQAGIENPIGSGGNTGHASALVGSPIGEGHVTIGVDVFRRGEIRGPDRNYSRAAWTPGGSFEDSIGVSAYGNTILFFPEDAPPSAVSLGDCEGSEFTGPLSDPLEISGEGCGFARANAEWRWERRDRQTALLSLDHPAGEDGSLYVDARLVQGGFTRPYLAPAFNAFPVTIDGNDAFVLHRFAGHGSRVWRTEVDEHDLTLGLTRRLDAGVGYDLHVRSFRFGEDQVAGPFVRKSAIGRALAEGRYDLRNPLSTDPVHRAAVSETAVHRYRDRSTAHRVARATFDGSAFELPGGAIDWAAGAEFTREVRRWLPTYVDGTDEVVPDQRDVIGAFDISYAGDRDRLSEFFEVSLPLSEDWNAVLGGRHDDHDDVGSTLSAQWTSRYRLNDFLTFRSSWIKAEKPPLLGGLHTSRVITNPRIVDPQLRDRYRITSVSSGNPDLEPDDAETMSFGAVSRIGSMSLSADWYRTKLRGALVIVGAQVLVDHQHRTGSLPEGVRIVRHPDTSDVPGCPNFPPLEGRITCIVKPVTGDGHADVTGINLRAQWGWRTDPADFGLDAHWQHLTDYEVRALGVTEPFDFARNRVHAALRVMRGDWTAQWSAYGASSHEAEPGRFDAWRGHDLALRWRNAFGLEGMDLTGGILNVGDDGPSVLDEDPEYADETLDSIRGRTFFLSARTTW